MSTDNMPHVPKEKFNFVQLDTSIHDVKFETKPIGYFKDAWLRFRKNKGAVVAACIIVILMIFAVVVPLVSNYDMNYRDSYYVYTKPKSELFSFLGWNGTSKATVNQQDYDYYMGMTVVNDKGETVHEAVVDVYKSYVVEDAGRVNNYYDVKIDTYNTIGYVYKYVTPEEYERIRAYEEETGNQVIYPMIDTSEIKKPSASEDANLWFEHDTKGRAKYDENGNFVNIYLTDENGDYVYYKSKMNGNQYQIRVCYYDYYVYYYGFEPCFVFGADGFGQDILVRLANGARLSFLLAFSVAAINFIIGTFYGAIEGYYGGWVDIIMERISDILSGVPFIVTATLFQMHLANRVGVVGSLIFAFILTGWLSTSYRVRTQFYRFKGQEYVLAARTLGAKDARIIFHHILPNSLGTIVTSCILMIPSVIFTESSLAYLNIVDLQTTNFTSVGTLLSNGQSSLSTYPHCIFWPALFISLLMISFNMFGNGLRDALNPSLRGADD